jgi:hypothetical protein
VTITRGSAPEWTFRAATAGAVTFLLITSLLRPVQRPSAAGGTGKS